MEQQINKNSDTYKGNVSSCQYNGEATLIIEETGLTVSTLFFDFALRYEEISSICAGDYDVKIEAASDSICVSRLGQSNDWFFNNLTRAYNGAVTKALKVSGDCVFETQGKLTYENVTAKGKIQVYEDSLCLLPPVTEARRFPFSFFSGIAKEDYAIKIQLNTGENATISMVGRDLDPLEKKLIEGVRGARDKNGALACEICETLNAANKAKASNVLHEKLAVPVNRLKNVEGLYECIMDKVAVSDMKKSWDKLNELCDGEKAAVGIWKLSDEEVAALKEKLLEKLQAEAGEGEDVQQVTLTPEQEEALKWMIWAAIPSKDERIAIVEAAFPTEEVATYIYKIPAGWPHFLNILNRGMEAMDFERDIILLAREKLTEANNAPKKILIERTPAVEMLRSQLLGRVIHRTEDGWVKNIKEYLK